MLVGKVMDFVKVGLLEPNQFLWRRLDAWTSH